MTSPSSVGCARPEAGGEGVLCPVSRTVGLKVAILTVKALLKSSALRRLDGKAYRFCPDPACDTVYFDREAGSVFKEGDLGVRVGLKESEEPIPVCYCFDITVADLRDSMGPAGETDIPAMIAAEIKAGHCACEVKNPQGSCCLGDVSRAIRRIRSEFPTATVS